MGFFPTLWADNALMAFREKSVIAQTVNREFDSLVKSGASSVEVPKIASVAATTPPLSFADATKTSVVISLDKQKAVPIQVKNLEAVQSNVNILNALTADAGGALSEAFDKDIMAALVNASTASSTFRKKMAGGASAITLQDFINAQSALNTAKVPQADRYCIIPADLYGSLFKISEFTSSQYLKEKFEGGVIGTMMGFKLIVSANAPGVTCEADWTGTGAYAYTAVGDAGALSACIFYHRNAVAAVMQQELNARSTYSATTLADQITVESIYGVGTLRDSAVVVISEN